jgi:heme-degrading monooxygenase HmoA
MAVKILIKRKFKDGNMQAASRLLINNRNGAMMQPGYISSETLRNIDDRDQVVVVSMWDKSESWNAWKNSEARMANEAEFKDYLIGETEYEHYSLGLSIEEN